jgi:two-component system response regulator YesN
MKKWNSVFANLAFSYAAIVLVIVLLLCSVFYIYFSKNYKDELRDKNQLLLENTAQAIETSVLQRVRQVYLDLSVDKTADIRLFADASYQTKLSKAIDLQELLKSEVNSYSDIVQAIHLYYPGQNIMLSSLYGLNFNANQDGNALFLADWIEGMRSNKQSSLWTPTRQIPKDIFSSIPDGSGSALLTYAHTYPFRSSGEHSELIIAIDVKESAINGVIQMMMPAQYANTLILDGSGSMISGSVQSGSVLRNPYDADTTGKLMRQTKHGEGSFEEVLDQTAHIVTYQAVPETGWKIYSAIPSSIFYSKLALVQNLVLGICLLAILIGMVLSGLFAKASYSPIKRLVGKVKGLPGHAPGHAVNEYGLIDTAFVRLNDKVSSLEETLHANSPVIKHNALMKLLQHSYSRDQLTEELQILGISPEYRHFCCMIVNMRKASSQASSGNQAYPALRLIAQLEEASTPECHIIGQELPDNKIAVVVCAKQSNEALREQFAHTVIMEGKQLQLDYQMAWSTWVQEINDVHKSYIEAQTFMKYGYFLPDTAVLNDRSLLERERSAEEIPQSTLSRFKEKLHARQLDEVIIAVNQLVAAMSEGTYSADYCHFILSNTVFVYSDYLKSVRYQHPVQGHLDLYYQYNEKYNIEHFREWLVDSISVFIAQMEKRTSDRALSSIESVKQYIQDHLAEDLSLETVAAKVFISPKYLSKLFKEESGVTYTEYVTSQRMDKARLLIESNRMTVEQVASTVGYSTAAYFIKRFKEMYGCTPRNYLRSTANRAVSDAASVGEILV